MKTIKFLIAPLALLLLIAAPGLVKSQLATWSNVNANTPMTLASVGTGVNASATSTTRVGLAYSSSGARWSSTGWNTTANYINITVTAAAGYALNLNSSSVVLNMGSSNTGPGSFLLYSSVNSYASPIATVTTACGSSVQSGNISYSLPSSGYSGLSSITFRVVGSGTACNGSATASGGTGGPSAVIVNGTATAAGPTVDNPAVTNIIDTSAKISANLSSNGGTTITQRGFVWSLATNPISGNSGVTTVPVAGTGVGAFDTTYPGFPPGTKIFFKGYVKNSNGFYYTTEVSFFTQSREPVYPSSFTATAISKNSIKLDWTAVPGASGYLVIQRQTLAPTGSPMDKTAYAANQILGDGTIIGLITSGATITTTINGLTQGTRYFYTLFPYGYNGANVETYNYRTVPVVPLATDSTWGYPPSYASIIKGVAGSETPVIASTINDNITTATSGVRAWKLQVMDGGLSLNDPDDLPTTLMRITLKKGPRNDVANWVNSIQSAGLIDDSTGAVLATGVISSTTIIFNSLNVVAADNNYHTLSVRVSIKKAAQVDRDTFQFQVDSAGTLVKTTLESSQLKNFVENSDSSKNVIDVAATKLRFVTQPQTTVEAGVAMTASIQVDAVDTFNVRDLDYTGNIQLDATGGNLIAAPRIKTAVAGLVTFDTIRFNKSSANDTLLATSGSLIPAKSNKFTVEYSKGSDIITDGSFSYPQNILHVNYTDTNAVTMANSLEVMSFYLRDGGAIDDNDFEPTTLSSLTLTTTNSYLIHKAALYIGSTKVAQADSFTTSGSNKLLVFSGLSMAAPDNDSLKFSLRVTFNDSAVDGNNFGFKVTAATASAIGTIFAAADAGGATSSTAGNNNRVDVVAKKIIFTQQPTDISEGSIQTPSPMVAAVDTFGNFDLITRNYTLTVLGGSIFDFRAIKSTGSVGNGTATFAKLVYNNPATGVKIVAHTTGLDSTLSDLFEVLKPTWFRSVQSGNWYDIATWEYSKNYGTSWLPATIAPDYSIHGQITVRSGHTVQMNGSTINDNIIDEVTVENGAVLVSPQGSYKRITVADGLGNDLVVSGKLLQNNPIAGNGIDIATGATVIVKKGGSVELAAFGDAAHWAGNPGIHFEDSSFYIHNTPITNTIGAVTMFANSGVTEVPVFRIAQDYTYPGTFVNPLGTLTINGLLSVDSAKTLTIMGGGERLLRNGITGMGDIVIADSGRVRITGAAQISGSGKIYVNHAQGLFQIAATSHTDLKNDKEINSNANNGLSVAGTLDGHTFGFSGNGGVKSEDGANIITAHLQGLGGLFNTSGNKNYGTAANYIFNGSALQRSGNAINLTTRTIQVNNTVGLTLTGPVQVTDTLFIGQSNVNTNATAVLSIAKGGVINGYSATSFINGPLRMWTENGVSQYFPIGSTTYGPAIYHNNIAEWVTLEYVNKNPKADGMDTAARGEGLASIKATEYWKISSAAKNGTIEIPYTSKSAVTATDSLNVRVVSWNGSRWISEGPAARTATTTNVVSDLLKNYSVATIGLDSACTLPASPAITNLNVCVGNTANLNTTGTGTVRWFINSADKVPFAQGNTVNVGVLSADSVFYADVKNIGCISNRVAYTVKVNNLPAAPVLNGPSQICYNTTAQLSADTAGTQNWYSDVNATAPAFTGDVFTTSKLTSDTSFFVEKVINGCASSTRTRIDVDVRAELQAPFSTGATVCSGTKAIVDAASNNSIRWYADATTTTSFFTGTRYTSPVLTANATYYVESYDGTCASLRTPIAATVLALPTAPVLTQPSVCSGNTAQINATGTGTIYWYNDTTTASVNSGSNFTTAPLTATRTYYASLFDGNCYSPKVPATVNVFAIPAMSAISVVSSIPTNQTTAIQTSGSAQHIDWDFGTGATPQTATGAGPHNVKWTTLGTKTVKLKLWNGINTCATDVQTFVNVGPGLGIPTVNGISAKIYPNPANAAVTVDVAFDGAKTGTIELMDATGKAVYTTAFETVSEINKQVDVSALAKGLYMLKISTGSGVSVHKIVVQ